MLCHSLPIQKYDFKWNSLLCSTIMTEVARRRRRRISVPSGAVEDVAGVAKG